MKKLVVMMINLIFEMMIIIGWIITIVCLSKY